MTTAINSEHKIVCGSAEVRLILNHEKRTAEITPPYGEDNDYKFRFSNDETKLALWADVGRAITEAVKFAQDEFSKQEHL